MTKIESAHSSGLNFDWVVLRELRFEDNVDTHGQALLSDLQANVDLKTWVSEDGRQCRTTLRVTISPKPDQAGAFRHLSVAVEGQFTAGIEREPTVKVEEFARRQAPAILFPFVRQMIATATASSRFGQLLLPPINVVALVSTIEQAKAPTEAR